MRWLSLFAALVALAAPARAELAEGLDNLTVDDCVRLALAASPHVAEAEARVAELEGRLAEVQSVFYPKLQATAFLAPMFTVVGGVLAAQEKWQKLSYWGPYTRLVATLAQPLYTFGRAEAGETAAFERTEVERARVREAENAVALEVRRLYYGRLYALSLMPTLDQAAESLDKAMLRAQELYDSASGEITQMDLNKLVFARAEVQRFQLIARQGASLALAALRHAMSLPIDAPLTLAEDRLVKLQDDADLTLTAAIEQAIANRPEVVQLAHGKRAVGALRESESAANWPVLMLAGQLEAGYSPTRENASNPYHYDPYNELVGGIALALRFDLDPAKTSAKVAQVAAAAQQIGALERLAATGIPVQVQKAHSEVRQARELAKIAAEEVRATKKWMTFASTAYTSGTGDARDLLEGLGAYLQAQRTYFDTLHDFYVSRAELLHAIGRGQ